MKMCQVDINGKTVMFDTLLLITLLRIANLETHCSRNSNSQNSI